MLLHAAFFHKMDTSSGLSSIASLSLGFTMSMRAGGMAFAANRGGPLASGATCAWLARPPSSNPSTVQPSADAAGGTSPRDPGDKDSSRPSIESCRSLVVPCVSLVSAPLASKDRQLDADPPPPDQPSCRPVSPIIEVPEETDSPSTDSPSTDDEHQLTTTTVSNADWSPSVIDVPTVVDFQTIPEGPVLQLPCAEVPPDNVAREDQNVVKVGETLQSPTKGCKRNNGQSGDGIDIIDSKRSSRGRACRLQTIPEGPVLHLPSLSGAEVPPDNTARKHETVVQIGETLQSATTDCRRNSGQSGDAVDIIETKRSSLGHVCPSAAECSMEESASTDDSQPMPLRDRETTNSGGQVRDDVIVVMDNNIVVMDDNDDVNGDLVGTFFTPSIADSFAEAVSPPPCESEPIITGGVDVRDTDSPVKQVPDPSAVVVADGASRRPEATSAALPLLKNGADSTAGVWSSTNRPQAESSAAATSMWRKNPLSRLVRHRKDTVCPLLCLNS